MFHNKKDVDRHVETLFRKVKGENERKCKYYSIAKLYFQVGDYESARKYIANYLSVRDDCANAHKLYGQALEALGQKENAMAEYKCAYTLDASHTDLLLKVCEILGDSDIIKDKSSAQYWLERTEQLFPHHPLVFKLKEKLVSGSAGNSTAELEKIIESELAARPKDVTLHVRLLQLYRDSGRVKEAYNTAVEVESRFVFRNELKWYERLVDIFKAYSVANKPNGWEFYLDYTAVLERAACLNLQEQYGSPRCSWTQAVNALFSFDQVLEEAFNQTVPSADATLYQEFLKHQRAQLCFYFATILFKKAKKDPSSWRDLLRGVAPLLLHAQASPPDLRASWVSQTSKNRRKNIDWWAKEAGFRNSQSGHIILGLLTERRSHFLERVTQFCCGNWRERLFQRIFTTRDHLQCIGTSHLVNYKELSMPRLHLPSLLELSPYDDMSQRLHPESLHHFVWLGLRKLSALRSRGEARCLGTEFRCLIFEDLQVSCNNPSIAGSETLCQLDIDAFLYAAVLCARGTLDEEQAAGYRSSDRPLLLPANITEYLCTIAQGKWWSAAYRVYTNQARADLGEVRQTLQRGVEVIRVMGNHGLDVRLVVQLARIFSERAVAVTVDQNALESRAAMYWTCALPLLEKLQRRLDVRLPNSRLFEFHGKELFEDEIADIVEEGQYFLACQMMKEDKHEKALECFQKLKSPEASFKQAMIYKKLAAQELQELHGEHITSEMRSRHIILLTKARESLYLTLDRLRSPGVDRKHPLNMELSSHIEEIESQLGRIDSDMWRDVNRNDVDGASDGSVSSGPSVGENGNSVYGLSSSFVHMMPRHLNNSRLSSTPYRSSHNHRGEMDTPGHDRSRRTEARPSPERLEAQIRYLMHGRDSQMQQVLQQNKALLDSHRTVADNLNKVANSLEELKNLIQELVKRDSHKRSESQLNSDLPHVGDPDDDLYVFEEDYSEDVTATASQLSQYQPFPQYPAYGSAGYRPLSGMMGSTALPYGATPGVAATDTAAAIAPPQHQPSLLQLLPPAAAAGMNNFFRNVDPALMYPPTLSYYGQGALPFSEGQQLPDFRAPPPGAGSVFSRLGAAVPPVPAVPDTAHGAKLPPSAQQAPVNVVITSSDTLPTTVPQTQPTLSVTIPPQHRLGTPLVHPAVPTVAALPQPGVPPVGTVVPPGVLPIVAPGVPAAGLAFPGVPPQTPLAATQLLGSALHPSSPIVVSSTASSTVPHAFQISMPPQAQVPVASRLEKGAAALSPVLPISTQTLLSSVPSPVYSAVGKDLPATPNTSTGTPKSTSPPKSSKGHRVSRASTGSEDGAAEEGEHDPCPDFQPLIPLPAEVELTTGEEEEAMLFECRCKLFRFVEREWKERGIGQLKILRNKETGKVRILMRREQVLKVCANHFLNPDMVLTRMSDKAWIWAANDFADEKVKLEKLCARFKTVDDAANFADAFSNACELSKEAKTTPIKDSNKEAAVTATPPSSTSSSATTTPTSQSEKFVVGGFSFIAPPKFTPPSHKEQVEKEADKKENDKVPGSMAKPSPFAMFSFSAATAKSPTADSKPPASASTLSGTASAGQLFSSGGQAADSWKPQLSYSSSSVASQSHKDMVTPKDKITSKDAVGGGDALMFKTASNLPTFSTVAATASEEPAFPKSTTFKGFEGAGTPLFSKLSTSAVSQKKEATGTGVGTASSTAAGEDDGQDFVPTQEFAPVIPLPELVVVKTGEEGQEVIFQERSKLLRFDQDVKQWKDRGVGTFKILKDPQTGRIRLLMRREQVLKVCCNHMLTAAMNFTALSTSDRAWSWFAQDYSEGEMKGELLALKFKTVTQADVFGNKIKELQAQMVDDKVPVDGSMGTAIAGGTSSTPVFSGTSTAVKAPGQMIFGMKAASSAPELWKCAKCTFPNAEDANMCGKCGAAKPRPRSDTNIPSESKPKLSEMFKPAPGSWECPSCYTRNQGTDHCVCCMEGRPGRSPLKPKQGVWECKTCYTRNEETDRMCSSCESEKPTTATPTKQNGPTTLKPLSEMFKPKAGSWECPGCMVPNDANVIQCPCCCTVRPGHEDAVKKEAEQKQQQAQQQQFTFSFGIPKQPESIKEALEDKSKTGFGSFSMGTSPASQPVFGSWTVGASPAAATTTSATTSLTFGTPSVATTSAPNQSAVISSTTSGSKSEASKPFHFEVKPAPFQFGTPGSGAKPFSFGVAETTPKKDTPEAGTRNFVFGSPQNFEFNFSGVRPKSPVKSPKSPGVVGASGGEDESGSEPEEDEGEHIYFQPVIPLPDKVPLHTGEEEEDVLYSHRAKLFRFVDGMWKERGVGDIKILKHRGTQKIRLVMRREQVLKLCLNHFLTPNMLFTEKDEKSYLWSAADFSEGEIRQESLAIRFQSKDIAASFKEAIDQAQEGLVSPSKTDTPATIDKKPAIVEKAITAGEKEQSGHGGSLTEDLKSLMFAGSKSTPLAAPSGPKGVARALFGTDAPTSETALDLSKSEDDIQVVYESSVTPEEKAAALRLKLPPNFYAYRRKPPCSGCCGCEPDSESEEKQTPAISQTNAPKFTTSFTTSTTSTTGLLFSAPTTVLAPVTQPSTFIFTTPITTATTTAASTMFFGQAAQDAQNKTSGFNLGTGQTQKNVFGTPGPTPPTGAPSTQSTAFTTFSFSPSENKDIKQSTFGQNLFSNPSVTSASSLFAGQSDTGMFSSAVGSSIFGSQSNTAGPGLGQSALKSTPTFGQTAPIFGQKSVSFFSQGATKPEPSSIFGGAMTTTTTTTTSSTTASATPVFGLHTTTAITAALSTPTFGLQTNSTTTTTTITTTSTPNASSSTTNTSIFSAKPSFTFSFNKTQDTKPTGIVQPVQPTSAALFSQPVQPTSPAPFSQIVQPAPPAPTTQSAQQVPVTLPTMPTPSPLSAVVSQTAELSSEPPADVQEQAEEGVLFLPTDSSLTFATLASQPSQAPFLKAEASEKPFSWAGAGSQVFGSRAKPQTPKPGTPKDTAKKATPKEGGKEDSSDDEEGTGEGEEAHDPHFEPIVALPDAIEVRTGEEEEEKVFCQRAKLFRFETELREWKERGVGEMKILKDPVRGTYRLLLRRDQVYKVVLNQRLTPAMTLSPLSNSESAWCWGGMNFAEDESSGELKTEPKVEKLAARFKNRDVARDFEDCVKACVAQLVQEPAPLAAPLLPESVLEPRPTVNSTQDNSEEDREKHEEDDDEDEDDEEEDDDDCDRNIMYEKRATLEAREPGTEMWSLQGMGALQILYDRDYFFARVYMEADNSRDIICSTVIAMNTDLEVRSKDCIWTAKDYSTEPPVTRTFKARFSSETAAEEFKTVFTEGREMAEQCNVMDHLDPSEL